MLSHEITQRWLSYFEAKGHHVVPSASLVSQQPGAMFTIAGMVPFIPYLSLIHISEPTRLHKVSRMPSSA